MCNSTKKDTKMETKKSHKIFNINLVSKKIWKMDNACTSFFSCPGTSKEPKKFGMAGVPQKNFFYFLVSIFASFLVELHIYITCFLIIHRKYFIKKFARNTGKSY